MAVHSTPVFLPGKSHRMRSPASYSPWSCQESDTAEDKHFHTLSYNPRFQASSWGLRISSVDKEEPLYYDDDPQFYR